LEANLRFAKFECRSVLSSDGAARVPFGTRCHRVDQSFSQNTTMSHRQDDSTADDSLYMQRLVEVNEAMTAAIELVKGFSEIDPHDITEEENPWKNPHGMLQQMKQARTKLNTAVQALKDQDALENAEPTPAVISDDEFAAAFIDLTCDAFADVLDDLRQNDEIDVDILADCLQSGMDILSMESRELFFDADEEEEPIHQSRRRQLGYAVEMAH